MVMAPTPYLINLEINIRMRGIHMEYLEYIVGGLIVAFVLYKFVWPKLKGKDE